MIHSVLSQLAASRSQHSSVPAEQRSDGSENVEISGKWYHFFSCRSDDRAIRELARSADSFEGLYYVCGRHPWLAIRRFPPPRVDSRPDGLDTIDLRSTRAGHNCFGQLVYQDEAWEGALPVDEPTIQSFLFARPFQNRSIGPRTQEWDRVFWEILSASDPDMPGLIGRRSFRLFSSEWWHVGEVLTQDFSELAKLLEKLSAKGFDTSTKCVLVRWKDREEATQYFAANKLRSANFDSVPKPAAELKATMVIRNNRQFFVNSIEEQVRVLESEMRSGLPTARSISSAHLRSFLRPFRDRLCVEASQLTHPNPYIGRATVRPTSPSWQCSFVFIRATDIQQSDHYKQYQGLVTVTNHLIIPRVYTVTGEHDFVFPAYTLSYGGMDELNRKLRTLPSEGQPHVLQATILDHTGTKEIHTLTDPGREVAHALFRNASRAREFFDELGKLRSIWRNIASSPDGKAPRELIRGLSPRALSVHKAAWYEHADPQDIPQRVEDLGLNYTWEFSRATVHHAFVRLVPKPQDDPRNLEAAVLASTRQDEFGHHEIAFDPFVTPRHDIIGVARFAELAELERFLYRVKGMCVRVEYHVILSEIASITGLPDASACSPCVQPRAQLENPSDRNCAECGRYLSIPTPTRTLKLRVNTCKTGLEARKDWRVVVGVMDLRLTREDVRRLYAESVTCLKIAEASAPQETPLAPTNEQAAMDAFADALFKTLSAGPLAKADVVVFPEYCIPEFAAKLVIYKLLQARAHSPDARDRFVVLGTHLSTRRYNISPIVRLHDKDVSVFVQPKMKLSKHEESWKDPPRTGTGRYLFRSVYGNLMVPICSDLWDVNPLPFLDADILAVPAFHPGSPRTLSAHIRNNVAFAGRVVLFANGAARAGDDNRKRADSFIMVDGETKQADDISETVDINGISGRVLTRTIDLLALDTGRLKSRDGRKAEGVFPIHPDLWPADQYDAHRRTLRKKMKTLGEYVEGNPLRGEGELDDLMTVDWEEAKAYWRNSDLVFD